MERTALQRRPTAVAREAVCEYEELGFSALWIPESPAGKEALTHAAILLAASQEITVATGIAILWARDPIAMMSGSRTLADAFPGRFLLGLGVSHASTATLRGHHYRRPVASMRESRDRSRRDLTHSRASDWSLKGRLKKGRCWDLVERRSPDAVDRLRAQSEEAIHGHTAGTLCSSPGNRLPRDP